MNESISTDGFGLASLRLPIEEIRSHNYIVIPDYSVRIDCIFSCPENAEKYVIDQCKKFGNRGTRYYLAKLDSRYDLEFFDIKIKEEKL